MQMCLLFLTQVHNSEILLPSIYQTELKLVSQRHMHTCKFNICRIVLEPILEQYHS